MIKPHGGRLVNREALGKVDTGGMTSVPITPELARDIDNIAVGVFSPLQGFLCKDDFESSVEHMRLTDDTPWTIPIVMDTNDADLQGAGVGDSILLDGHGTKAIMKIEDVYGYDKKNFAEKVYATLDTAHPGVAKIMGMKEKLVGGRIELIEKPKSLHPDYALDPKETRILFKEKGWKSIVAFQTRNVPHIGHEFVQKSALTLVDGLLINPIIGKKKAGDFRDDVIIESYNALINEYYPQERAVMSILQTEMRYGGPREAIFHSIMRQNFGCTHFIVGRDHAGVGDYYHPFAAHEIFDKFPDLEIKPVFFRSFYRCSKCDSVVSDKTCPHGDNKDYVINFAGRKIRAMLQDGQIPPLDMMREEVAKVILKYDNPFVE